MGYYERLEQMRERKRQQMREHRRLNPKPTRAERFERTRLAVEEMIQTAYRKAGGKGDAGTRVL